MVSLVSKLTIKVTAEHLAFTPRSPYVERDLFTRVLARQGLGGVNVILIAGDEAIIPKKKRPEEPDLAWDLRERWANGEDIEPFEFEITWGMVK